MPPWVRTKSTSGSRAQVRPWTLPRRVRSLPSMRWSPETGLALPSRRKPTAQLWSGRLTGRAISLPFTAVLAGPERTTPARASPNKAIAQAGLACRRQQAGQACQAWCATRSATVPRASTSLACWATTSSPGRRPSRVPRKTRPAAGRPPMARTGFPLTPGSRHRGSVGDHPRYGDRAADPPAPSDSPSLGTHEGARRPALYGDTSARLAAAPYAPIFGECPPYGGQPYLYREQPPSSVLHSEPPAV
jgi:hypothetical protein